MAIGGNANAAFFSGINVWKMRFIFFALCSVLSAFSGVWMVGRLGSADPTIGRGMHFEVLSACILGGVNIPYEKGLLGHSDADVLLHAVSDALLGAAGLGDIGKHFPDTDPQYKGADSLELLRIVAQRVKEAGYRVSNVDVTMIAQRPKLRPHIETMEQNIAAALGIDANRVNVKATTEEHLGFTGTGEGMSCHAVCLLDE